MLKTGNVFDFFQQTLFNQLTFKERFYYYNAYIFICSLFFFFIHLNLINQTSFFSVILRVFLAILPILISCLFIELIGLFYYKQAIWPTTIRVFEFWLFGSLIIYFHYSLVVKYLTDIDILKNVMKTGIEIEQDVFTNLNFIAAIFLVLVMLTEHILRLKLSRKTVADAVVKHEKVTKITTTDLLIKLNGKPVNLAHNNIIFIQVEENYCHIWCLLNNQDVEKITVRSTLNQLYIQLPEFIFLKVHRSYIVNVRFIKAIKKDLRSYHLTLHDNMVIPISHSHLIKVKEVIQNKIN